MQRIRGKTMTTWLCGYASTLRIRVKLPSSEPNTAYLTPTATSEMRRGKQEEKANSNV